MEATGTQAKVKRLRAQQEKWMRERASAHEREKAVEELQRGTGDSPSGSGRAGGRGGPGAGLGGGLEGGQTTIRPEELMDTITARITERLREELKLEVHRGGGEISLSPGTQGPRSPGAGLGGGQARLEARLAKEIESHTCPICYELMIPPAHSPTLLFPCGHTFCSQCLEKHRHQNGRCPYCREKIKSSALNISLQQLIQNYVTSRDQVEAQEAAVAAADFGGSGSCRNGMGGSSGDGGPGSVADVHFYRSQRRALEMRSQILSNELEETLREGREAAKFQDAARAVLGHLEEEEAKVRQQLEGLQAEHALILEQIDLQKAKALGLGHQRREAAERVDLLRKTLAPLEAEMEKNDLILSGLADA